MENSIHNLHVGKKFRLHNSISDPSNSSVTLFSVNNPSVIPEGLA